MQLQLYYSKAAEKFSWGFLFVGFCGGFFVLPFGGEKNKEGRLGGFKYTTLILCTPTLNTASFLLLPVAVEALW